MNAHKLGVLPKGSKYAKGTANMAELEMGSMEDRTRDKILSAFGVPKTLVGLTTEVNRASAEAAEYVFAKYTVKPIADDFVEFLNNNVVPIFDTTGQFYFAYDDFVPENMELKLKEREIALAKQPYMTVNEVRASVGLPPVPNGDQVYSAPGTPLGEPVIAPTPANDTEEDDQPKKAMPARARAALKRDRVFEGIAKRALQVAAAAYDPDADSHREFVARVEDNLSLLEEKVRTFNERQQRDVLENLTRVVKAVGQGDLFEMEGEVSVLVDFVSPLLKGLLIEQALAEYLEQDFEGQFDQAQPRVNQIVEFAAKRLARSYNKTTAKLLVSAINDGIAQGEGLTQLIERVKGVYDFSSTYRAAQVAHTEAFCIANEGSREAFRQSGVVETMRWYTADGDACQFCAPMNGKVIGVNDNFFPKGHVLEGAEGGTLKLDYRAIDVPPLHTRCRCFVRPATVHS